MASGADDDSPPDYYLEKLKAWKAKLKAQWDYNRKLIAFKGSDGQEVTFTTTTSTTTTTPTPTPNATTPRNTTFSPVIVITTQQGGAKTGETASASATQLITIVGITCASLLAIIVILLIFIRLCRSSSSKRRQRISLRRPLNPPEPEDHIYAEIEPLQRTTSPGGASGTSADVPLPSKKHRKRGVSSFRALSTRIYRFFSHDQSDNQSVFYNRNEHQASAQHPPEPPERNASPRKKRGPGVKRFESTASRRALLDGDSQNSNSSRVEMRPSTSSEGRDNIYNPLLRESDSRVSGPYDHLTLAKTETGEGMAGGTGDPPDSPHDYFTLEKNTDKSSPRLPDRNGKNHLSPVTEDNAEDNAEDSNPLDTLLIENEKAGADNTNTPTATSIHDYFVLEPHKKSDSVKVFHNKPSASTDNSPIKEAENGSANKSPVGSPKKQKPVVKPRVTKSVVPDSSNPSSSTDDSKVDTNDVDVPGNVVDDMLDDANYIDPCAKPKDDIYVLSKLGTAPEPPQAEGDQEYLSPLDVKHRDYIDVIPNPPPRTTSLHPEELASSGKHETVPESPKKHVLNESPKRKSPRSSPTKKTPQHSPTKKTPHHSPTKQNSQESPSKHERAVQQNSHESTV